MLSTAASDVFAVTRDPATGVAELCLRGTSAGNAMGAAVWTALPEAVAALEADDSVRAVVVRGAGDCFSVGIDLRWYLTHYRRMIRGGDGRPAMRRQLSAEATAMQDAIGAVAASPLPFVAAVHGACVGAAFELATACDIRMASADAHFALREVCIGIVADLGALQRLPAIIGGGPTRELALTGRDVPADEALRRGLVTTVLPTAADLFGAARSVAARIARHPQHVVAGIKDVLTRSQDLPMSAGLRYVNVWNAAFLPSPELPVLLTDALRASAGGDAGSPADFSGKRT
jgi:enoyl-CoA hydratase